MTQAKNMRHRGEPSATTSCNALSRRHMLTGLVTACSLGVSLLTGQGSARADDYPSRPITFVVPFAPGGPTDLMARLLADAMSPNIGQPIIVENRPGAAGSTGIGVAARAKPDGYSLLLTSTSIAVNPALSDDLPFDPIKDFAPISELVNSPNVIIVRQESSFKTIKDVVAFARANPDKLNYASPGAGTKSQLTGEWLKQREGINIMHIPYRGAGPSTAAVLQGDVQMAVVALPPAEPLIKEGRLRALGVTGKERWFTLPDVPTMIELGYPGFVSDTFQALLAPAGTPQPILDKLTAASHKAMLDPNVVKRAEKLGFVVVNGKPDDLGERIKSEVVLVKDIVSKANLKAR